MPLKTVSTTSAPQAIGSYSQAVHAGDFLYVSGQIPLCPDSMEIVEVTLEEQAHRVFKNIRAIAEAAGTTLQSCVKLNISMVDLSGFETVNQVMAGYFDRPYPARACVGVAALPKNALIEVESIFYLGN